MNQYLKSENINFALANLPQLVFEITDACNLKCKYCGLIAKINMMKKLAKLRLNVLNEQDLEDKQMNSLKGGSGECFCSCYYANSGVSSASANRSTNAKYGYYSGSGCNQYSQAGNYIGSCSNCMA